MSVTRFLNPKFYINHTREWYWNGVARRQLEWRRGSAAPFLRYMCYIAVGGYLFNYHTLEKHHIAAKQDIINEALAAHKH